MIRRPPRSTLFPYTNALPISDEREHVVPFTARTRVAQGAGPAARGFRRIAAFPRSEEHTSELQSQSNLVCRLLLEKKKNANTAVTQHFGSQLHREPRHQLCVG